MFSKLLLKFISAIIFPIKLPCIRWSFLHIFTQSVNKADALALPEKSWTSQDVTTYKVIRQIAQWFLYLHENTVFWCTLHAQRLECSLFGAGMNAKFLDFVMERAFGHHSLFCVWLVSKLSLRTQKVSTSCYVVAC